MLYLQWLQSSICSISLEGNLLWFWFSVLLQVKNLLEVLAHEVWSPLVAVEVLQEAKEDGVNSHRVDREETGSNGISADHYEEKRCKLVVQLLFKNI